MTRTPQDLYLKGGKFTGNSYQNDMMRDMRFRVIEDANLLLEPGTDWIYISDGGFTIIRPGYTVNEDSRFCVQFY